MENPWYEAVDALPSESEIQSVDQKLAYAQVCALLAIGQELNALNLGESKLGEDLRAALRKQAGKPHGR